MHSAAAKPGSEHVARGVNPTTVRGRVLLVVGLLSHRATLRTGTPNVAPIDTESLPVLHREDIAVECWRLFGGGFAMQRHDYPNPTAAQSKITDLVSVGLVSARETGMLSLTPKGWWWWQRVMRQHGGAKDPMASGLFTREGDAAVSSGESSDAR